MLPVLTDCQEYFSSASVLKISLDRNPDCHYLLTDKSRNGLKKIKVFLENQSDEGNEILKEWLKEHEHFPPLELIWWFQNEEVLLVTTYFYLNKRYCDYFYKVFEDIYSSSYEKAGKQEIEIIASLTATFINTLKHSNDALQLFIEEITDNVIVKIAEMMESNTLKRSPILDIKQCSNLDEECLKEFAQLHLKYLLSMSSDYSVKDALEKHAKQWTTNILPDSLKQHIYEVLSIIPIQKIIDEINEQVNEMHINWKYLFIIISVLVKNSDNAFIVKGAVDVWLKQSCDEDDFNTLYLPVLIARHCCYEKARYFQSYANWFSSLNFKNIKFFSLFFKFLTHILPQEPPLYLKIHLNKVPSAPHGCQSILVDYIVLAKTRLTDLNESGEYIGLFSDHHETDEEGHQTDIARVIAHYTENNEIAKPLLEAFVLRRQYYEKVFLKHLLKVPECEDAGRARVIHKLHSIGKISPSLFDAWTKL